MPALPGLTHVMTTCVNATNQTTLQNHVEVKQSVAELQAGQAALIATVQGLANCVVEMQQGMFAQLTAIKDLLTICVPDGQSSVQLTLDQLQALVHARSSAAGQGPALPAQPWISLQPAQPWPAPSAQPAPPPAPSSPSPPSPPPPPQPVSPDRKIKTVVELWKEYDEGFPGRPALKSVYEQPSYKWTNENDRKFYCRRLLVIREVKRRAEAFHLSPTAVAVQLDAFVARQTTQSLNKLQDMIRDGLVPEVLDL